MTNENLLDQFFLIDKNITRLIVATAELGKKDSVLEIGAGSGIVTREIAQKAGKVLAVEIDRQFEKDLKKIHGRVQAVFADALKVLREKRYKFNKIVGSLPSSIIEPLMRILTRVNFDLAIFLVPLKFAYKLKDSNVFSAFFKIEILEKVFRKSFSPVPKTNWAMIKITRKPDPLKTGERKRFLQQFTYEHPRAELNNALTEGLVRFYKFQGRSLTKNQAREIIGTENPL